MTNKEMIFRFQRYIKRKIDSRIGLTEVADRLHVSHGDENPASAANTR